MSNLQSTLIIENRSNTSLFLLDIRCGSCEAITRAADIVFGRENQIFEQENTLNTYYCKGCETPQPYTSNNIERANRAGKIADHIIQIFPDTDNRNFRTTIWVNTHTNKMLFVPASLPTFNNVQNKLYIPTKDQHDLIELKYQLEYELNKDKNVPAVVQRILKQWQAIHPFLLLADELEQPGALFDVCALTIEKTPSKLTARRTFIGSKLNRQAYFLDNEHIHLKSDYRIFNESISIKLGHICNMQFHGDKRLSLYIVKDAEQADLIGKYIEVIRDPKNDTIIPLAIFKEKPTYI